MKIISLFNNKGGVGKTTLAFHLSHVLAEMGKKVLVIDLDPQCNITICGIDQDTLGEIWKEEDPFIADYESAAAANADKMGEINSHPHSIHYLLKPTEDGIMDITDENLPPAIQIAENLDLIPGRLTVHKYEAIISERWAQAYQGAPLAIRTLTRIRTLAEAYGNRNGYDFVIIDTSPSLGALNKVIISTVDGFVIPCLPDMFSLYGIRNIGDSLKQWQRDFNTIYTLISDEKRSRFPDHFVRFLGYTIYNAKKYTRGNSPWALAQAHQNYAMQIPQTINDHIVEEVRGNLTQEQIKSPIGDTAVMHTHNTLPNMAQKYRLPIWKVPACTYLDPEDKRTISVNAAGSYLPTREKYEEFANDFLTRVETLG